MPLNSKLLEIQIEESETDIKKIITQYLKRSGYFVIRINSGRAKGGKIHMAEAGTPDIFALKDGQSYFLETKKNSKLVPSAIQQEKMRQIESHGGVCYVVSSLEQVQEVGL